MVSMKLYSSTIKSFLVALILLVAVSSHSTALAQSSTNTLSPKTKEKVTELAADMKNKMEANALRLQNISNKINSVVDRTPVDSQTSLIKSNLAKANTLISNSNNSLKNIDVEVSKAVNSDDPKSAWLTVRQQFSDAENNIKQTYQILNEVFSAIYKPNIIISNTPNTNSTATATTATN